MKIYLAGISTVPEMVCTEGHYLESYLYFRGRKESIREFVDKWKIKDLFLDSGAFSAFTIGSEIDIKEYARVISENKDVITKCANLDVIGDAEATYRNWLFLKEKGIDALPVIHYGAEEKWFSIYLKEHKVDYLALGGLVPYTKRKVKLKKWLDYSYMQIKPYFPVKTHLFGVTTNWVLERYPLYSCDSTGWLYAGKRGRILMFNGRGVKEHNTGKVYAKVRDFRRNNIESGLAYMKFERYLTKLWEKKGIKWA